MSETQLDHINKLEGHLLTWVLGQVRGEVDRQDDLARAGKFGGTHIMPGGTDLERLAVLAEEFGEISIEVCKGITPPGVDHIRREGLREELIQTAAVCVAWAAAIDDYRAAG